MGSGDNVCVLTSALIVATRKITQSGETVIPMLTSNVNSSSTKSLCKIVGKNPTYKIPRIRCHTL